MDWLELVKLAVRPRYSFALWVTSLIVLLIDFPDWLKLEILKDKYGAWIGLGALFCFVVWLVELTLLFFGRVMICYNAWCAAGDLKTAILSLNPDEKAILAKHLEKNSATLNWPTDKAGIPSLVHKGLLERIPTTSSFGTPYSIRSDVWKHLLNNKADVESTAP